MAIPLLVLMIFALYIGFFSKDFIAGVGTNYWQNVIYVKSQNWLDSSPFRSNTFKPLSILNFVFFVFTAIILGWIGQEVVEFPFLELSALVSFFYFLFFQLLSVESFFKIKTKF